MASLPASAPITLQQIQSATGGGSLTAASTLGGKDPLPTSMLDFLGWSSFSPFLAAYTTIGTTNLTVPAGCTQIEMLIAGGGGSGGGTDTGSGANNKLHAGGGGGGGGYVNQTINVTAGQSITIVVGAGGTNGVTNPNNWAHGSASSVTIGGTTYTAAGGLRGYFAVKIGGTGNGGNSGNGAAGGMGFGEIGSGGGAGCDTPGGNARADDTVPPQYYGGDGGGGNFTQMPNGYALYIGGGGAGGGNYAPGVSETTTYAGGGDGAAGITSGSYSGTQVGDSGTQGGVVFYYK